MSSQWEDFLATVIRAAVVGERRTNGWDRVPGPFMQYEDGSFGPADPDIKQVADRRIQNPMMDGPRQTLPQIGPANIQPQVPSPSRGMPRFIAPGYPPGARNADLAQRRMELDQQKIAESKRQQQQKLDAIRQKDTSQP